LLEDLIKKLLPGGPVYVRISSKRLTLREPATGSELSIEPVLMVAGDGPSRTYRLRSLPAPPRTEPVLEKEYNGFDHPRTIIADFAIAEKTLLLANQALIGKKRLTPSPIMVIHPLERVEGGLTAVERRALEELGAGAGARKVYVWDGRQLSDPEIQALGMQDDEKFAPGNAGRLP